MTYTDQPTYKNSKGKTRYAVIVRRLGNNNIVRLWGKKKGKDANGDPIFKFKASQYKPDGDGWAWRMSKQRAKAAKQWAKERPDKYSVYGPTSDRWPFLLIYNQVGNKAFGDDLQKTAIGLKRWLRCGWQRSKYSQWELYQGYRKGLPGYALAACCCSLCSIHDWATCQKNGPCKSNHCDHGGGGTASDTSVVHGSRSSNSWTSIRAYKGGEKELAKHGIYTKVASEDWHASRSGQ